MTTKRSIGALVDQMYGLELKRAKLSKELEMLKREEAKLEAGLLKKFSHSDLEGSMGVRAVAAIKRTTVGNIKDWNKFIAYCKKRNDFSLLEKRISRAAYTERLDSGVRVDGVEPFTRISIKVRKRKGKG